ncbi:MAG: bifunctional nuclease family protein [Bacteroidetes bacterium]|nr:bifunctional nuclease family protein [Bacteroidota bacterium]
MEKIKLEIIGLSYSQSQSGAYALILGETEGNRRLPIIIGGFEAQAIAIELEKIKPTRPLTHDLFRNFADKFGIVITEVIINKFHEGVFYSKLVCFDGEKTLEIDSRTSDAVALALRFHCPIYTYEQIMSTAGVIMNEDTQDEITDTEPDTEKDTQGQQDMFESHSLSELESMLSKAIENEDYEKASLIRDEIKRRK